MKGDVYKTVNDNRELTKEEIESIMDAIGENIDWYEAISIAMQEKNIS